MFSLIAGLNNWILALIMIQIKGGDANFQWIENKVYNKLLI
jgi:hypothetical protein